MAETRKKYRKDPKVHSLHCRLTDEEMEELKYCSYVDGRSMSDLVRRAIQCYYYIRKHEIENTSELERK